MSVIATIPQTTVPAGPRTFGPAPINSTATQYVLTLNEISWPSAGDLAFTLVCDVSLDGGNTWVNPPPASDTIFDNPIPSRHGSVANQIEMACTIPGVGNANRQIRLTTNFAKSLTVSGTLEAF